MLEHGALGWKSRGAHGEEEFSGVTKTSLQRLPPLGTIQLLVTLLHTQTRVSAMPAISTIRPSR